MSCVTRAPSGLGEREQRKPDPPSPSAKRVRRPEPSRPTASICVLPCPSRARTAMARPSGVQTGGEYAAMPWATLRSPPEARSCSQSSSAVSRSWPPALKKATKRPSGLSPGKRPGPSSRLPPPSPEQSQTVPPRTKASTSPAAPDPARTGPGHASSHRQASAETKQHTLFTLMPPPPDGRPSRHHSTPASRARASQRNCSSTSALLGPWSRCFSGRRTALI